MIAGTVTLGISSGVVGAVVAMLASQQRTAFASPWFATFLIISVVALTACVWLLANALARRITEPIESLSVRLVHFARHGAHLPGQTRVPYEELRDLQSAVDAMVVALAGRDRAAKTAAGALAHDVRISLRSVLTAVQQARDPMTRWVSLSPEVASLIEDQLDAARRMTNDLVLLMRARPSGEEVAFDEWSVDALVAEIAERFSIATNVAVSVSVEKAFSRSCDRSVVERVLVNLLDNATRHAREQVRLSVFDGLVVIADDGEGFTTSQRSATHNPMVGHGLSIATELIRLVGGRVSVERSNDLGTQVLVYV